MLPTSRNFGGIAEEGHNINICLRPDKSAADVWHDFIGKKITGIVIKVTTTILLLLVKMFIFHKYKCLHTDASVLQELLTT